MSWNRSNGDGQHMHTVTASRVRHSLALRGVIAGAAVVTIGAIVAFLSLREGAVEAPTKDVPKVRKLVTEVKPAASRPQEEVVAGEKPKDRYAGAVVLSARTNSNGVIMMEYAMPDGSRVTRKMTVPSIFSNACDKAIAMIVTSREGSRIPPLPPLNERRIREAFQQGLVNPIRISKDDSEKVAALKLAVKEIRAAIAENIRNGDSRGIVEMIEEHVRTQNDNANLRAEAARELKKVCEGESEEFARQYLKRVNEHLEKCGVRPLNGPHVSNHSENNVSQP